MIEIVCLCALTAILMLSFFFLFCEGNVSKKTGWQVLLVIAGIFVVFSFFFNPKPFIRWDLIEHFKTLKEMRNGGWDYLWKESQYADLFLYNLFAYLISLLPQNLWNLLSTIPLIIDFSIIIYIYKKTYNENFQDASGKVRILSVLFWLFTFGIKLAITGIRCSLAISLAVFAIYLEMIQKKNKWAAIALYSISVFIHNFVLVIIFVRLLARIKRPLILMLGSLTISLILEPFAQYIVENTTIEYLKFSFSRILNTIEYFGFSSAVQSFNTATLAVYMCFIITSCYLFVISWRAKKEVEKGSVSECIVELAIAVGAVAIGLSFNYLYLERFMYFVSYVLFLMIPIHNRKCSTIRIGNYALVPIALFMFFFNDIYTFIVNYVGFYFLAM